MKSSKTGTPQANAHLHQKQLKELEHAALEKRVADVDAPAASEQPKLLTDAQFRAAVKSTGKDPGAVVLPKTYSSVNALMQVVELRSKPKTPPKTAGAKSALLGVDVAAHGKGAFRLLSPKITAVALALLLFSGNGSDLSAQTLFVNVNGAKVTQAEVLGAKEAARLKGESFTIVRPSELAPVLERANAPGGALRKLVVSGHSSGLWVSGSDESGSHSLSLEDMKKHAAAYPDAFAKVQTFFAMACNIGTEENSRQWMALFPNLKSVVGFDNIGPASDRPAAGAVLKVVDAELQKVNWATLTRDGAMRLAQRLSNLPGVNVTEFSIRLRANDGTTVFFSKKNKPTSLTTASDLVNQYRPAGFTPWFEAKEAQYARPPADHGNANPIRLFYNATHTLLNAMGREIAARGEDPAQDWQYQRVAGEKEAALRLIYFDTVLQNAEFHTRPTLDQVVKELGEHGVSFEIPKLTRMTRTEIIALQVKLTEIGNYTWSDFVLKHADDIALVNEFAATQPAGPIALGDVNPKLGEWYHRRILDGLDEVIANPAAPEEVKTAATGLKTSLSSKPSAEFASVLRLFTDGLVALKVDAFPADWVTTDRPGV